jgi:hypothetical protein
MKVSELLTEPARWCKGTMAKTATGSACTVTNPDAQSFCLIGATVKCYPKIAEQEQAMRTLRVAISELGFGYYVKHFRPTVWISDFNDDARITFDQVRAVIERAGV